MKMAGREENRGMRVALVSTHSSDTWGRWVLPQAFSFLLEVETDRQMGKEEKKVSSSLSVTTTTRAKVEQSGESNQGKADK